MICAGQGEPVTVFTVGAHVTAGGNDAFCLFSALHGGAQRGFGTAPVFETNTTAATRFMLNGERVAYVRFRKRLYTYAEFVP